MVLTKLVFILKHKEIDILKANEVERWMNCGLNFNLSYNVCSSSWKFKRLTAFLSADIMDNKSIEKRKKYSSRLENRIQIRLEGLEALSTCPSPFPGRPQGACVTSHEETAGRSFPIHVYLLLLSLFSFSLIIFLFSLSYFRSFFRFLLEYLVSLLSLCYANSVECLSSSSWTSSYSLLSNRDSFHSPSYSHLFDLETFSFVHSFTRLARSSISRISHLLRLPAHSSSSSFHIFIRIWPLTDLWQRCLCFASCPFLPWSNSYILKKFVYVNQRYTIIVIYWQLLYIY